MLPAHRIMRIAVWAGNSIGGTEKAATLWAAGLARRGHHIDFMGPPGSRAAVLHQAGIPALDIALDRDALRTYLQQARPDIVHQHVPGYSIANPLYEIWPELGSRAPHLVETNVFGHFTDPEAPKWVKFRMFISLSCAAKAFTRARKRLDAAALRYCTVVCYPLESQAVGLDAPTRAEFRRSLGVAEGEVLTLRIGQRAVPGQPGNKWKRWECQAFARAKPRAPALRMLIMEPPKDIWQEIDRGQYGPGIIVRENTNDFEWLQKLYSSADCMVHASSYGESFGYTIAEAMMAGLPVIVRTTPWGDNAQVELVKNRETGFVCASVDEMSRRLVDLANDGEMRQRLGEAGRKYIRSKADLESELDVLEDVLHHVFEGRSGVALDSRGRELLVFASQFRSLEWRVSESPFRHPADYAGARLYAAYRALRTRMGRVRDRLFRGGLSRREQA